MTPVDQFLDVLNSSDLMLTAYSQFLRDSVHVKTAKAKEQLLPPGHHASVFYFVADGLIYSWHFNAQGERVPVHFARQNQFIGTVMNPLYPEHIADGITCLEPSVLVVGTIDLAGQAIARFEEARDVIGSVVNAAHRDLEKLHSARHLYTPEGRFEGVKALAPDLFDRVPQGLLAAYLNMSRVYFNRLKNRR